MKKKAVIFDLDGTLLNTIDDISDAVNLALGFYGFPLHSVEEYKYFVGAGIYHLALKSLPNDIPEDFLPEFVKKIQIFYKDTWNKKTCLYDGIANLLDELNARKIPIAVFSNKPHEFTILNVVYYLKKWIFNDVYGASIDKPKKPDPSVSFLIASRMQLSQDEIIHVGDTDIDIQTAKNAGMLPLGVAWGFRKEKELLENGAIAVLNHPSELLSYL